MKKSLLALMAVVVMAFTGCATQPTGPGVEPIVVTSNTKTQAEFDFALTKAYVTVNQIVTLANTAYTAKILKQADAENVLVTVKAARDGLAVARTLDPTSGINKINASLVILGATQVYLNAMKVPQ